MSAGNSTSRAKAIRLYTVENIGTTKIGRQLGVHPTTVRNWLLRAGVEMQRAGARPNPTVRHDYFHSIDSDAKAWLLGFIAADGNVTRHFWRINLKAADREILGRIRDLVAPDARITESLRPTRDGAGVRLMSTLSVASVRMVADLTHHGVVPRKSLIYRPWDGPTELLPAYVRGLIDGDGSWSKRKKSDRWGCNLYGTRAVCERFAELARKWAGATVHVSPRKTIWKATVGGTAACQQLARVLYAGETISLARKRDKVAELLATPVREQRDWSGVSATDLTAAFDRLGTWAAVSREFGWKYADLIQAAKRKGVPAGRKGSRAFRWGHLTRGDLERLFGECGSWCAVARRLGTTNSTVVILRRRHGLPVAV